MSNATYIDNKKGTIIKTLDSGEKFAYDFLVGLNIPKGDSIVDYCYYQLDKTLTSILLQNYFSQKDSESFCSGTCVAMILAISRGDLSIKPEDVVLWDNLKDVNGKSTVNWKSNGLRDWEQEYDILKDGGQIYDNRDDETWTYAAVDGTRITSEDEYLKSIKIYLSAGLPVIIDVGGHFVVVVGVESDIKLEKAEFKDLVIYDPGRSDVNQIVTLGKSEKKYNHASYRLLTPFPIVKNAAPDDDGYYPDIYDTDILDSEWSFVADENGEKTHDPYYLAPVRTLDEAKIIIPAKQGRPLKVAIEAVKNSTMSDEEKTERINELMGAFAERKYKELVVSRNGEYAPRDDEDIIAYDKVTVCLPMSTLTVHENGTYCAGERELEGYDKVIVNVPDNSDDLAKYKKLWEMKNGGGEPVETDIPKPEDSENPDNPDGGGNYVFKNAVDVGNEDELSKYTPLLADTHTIDIVETGAGLAIHIERIYNGNRIDVKMTVTNLKNGMSTYGDSCFRTFLDIRNKGCRFGGIQIHNGMLSSYFTSDFSFDVDTWLSEIDFHAPANWNRHFILV